MKCPWHNTWIPPIHEYTIFGTRDYEVTMPDGSKQVNSHPTSRDVRLPAGSVIKLERGEDFCVHHRREVEPGRWVRITAKDRAKARALGCK